MVKHTVSHFEWSCTDLERTKNFLQGLFGWEFRPWNDDYWLFDLPDGPDGGLMKVDKVEPGKSPYLYFEVDEIEPYLDKVMELGGGIEKEKTEIPGVGWYAHLIDPDGNTVGLMQNLPDEVSDEVLDEETVDESYEEPDE